MYINHIKWSKVTLFQAASFISKNWKSIFLLYALFIAYIFFQEKNFIFLINATEAFFVIALLAKNIHLSTEANRDQLTGLGNKNALIQRLNKEICRVERNGGYLTFLFFDIDNFKNINDTYGHRVGDGVLIEVANRLMAEMRPYDELARFGGDEFCVLCPQVKDEDASLQIGKKLHNALHFCYRSEKNEILIEASLGVSTYPIDTNNLHELIRIADHRMYEQKKERGLSRLAHANINN